MTILFLVALIGCAVLVLDVGSWFRDKRQLQTAADAAALAGAQSLPNNPAGANALAVQYGTSNGGGVTSGNVIVSSGLTANDTISVHATNSAPGFFSNVFGIKSVTVGASAVARSEVPAQALYVAPMVVRNTHPLLAGSGCPCFNQQTTLNFDPMGAPGAFGMLNLSGGSGTVGASTEGNWILNGYNQYLPLGSYKSDPGAKFSSANVQNALQARENTVLLFPVFNTLTGSGQNAVYNIIGWVGFYLQSFSVHGNTASLQGYFTTFIAHGIQATTAPTQPDFGVHSIQLIH